MPPHPVIPGEGPRRGSDTLFLLARSWGSGREGIGDLAPKSPHCQVLIESRVGARLQGAGVRYWGGQGARFEKGLTEDREEDAGPASTEPSAHLPSPKIQKEWSEHDALNWRSGELSSNF